MRRFIAMALTALLFLQIVCPVAFGATASDAHSVYMPEGAAPKDEFDRAAWYGFIREGAQQNPDEPVTERQMADMAAEMITAYQPSARTEWKILTGRASAGNLMYRDYAAMMLLYAAERIGCDRFNVQFAQYSGYTDWDGEDMWGSAQYEYPLFEDVWEQQCESITRQLGPEEDVNYLTAALQYVISRYSLVSGMQVMEQNWDFDLRCDERMSYREAAVAVVRLYESNEAVARLFPEDPETVEAATALLITAAERRDTILQSETHITKAKKFVPGETYSGKAYYVSNSGSDKNDGRSPERAWATTEKLNSAKLKKGDAVFFERGGLWREAIVSTRPGVTYSAYGEGSKPRLYGSPENGGGAERWTLYHEGEDGRKIWLYVKNMLDVGAIVLDEGRQMAEKVVAFWNGSEYVLYAGRLGGGDWSDEAQARQAASPAFDPKLHLTEDLTFFSKADSALPDTLPVELQGWNAEGGGDLAMTTLGPLYLRCDRGNPGDLYPSIEFLTPHRLFDGLAAGCVLDNLFIGYTGSSAMGTGPSNDGVTVQHCEIGWIGGTVASYTMEGDDGSPAGTWRTGGGCPTGSSGNRVLDNYIHDTYGEGVSLETFVGQGGKTRNIVDNLYQGNVLYRCSSGLVYFNWDDEPNPKRQFKDIVYEDNFVLYSGTSHWVDRENYTPAFVMDGGPNMQDGSVEVRNNVFFASEWALIYIKTYVPKYTPKFTANHYVQLADVPFLWHEQSFVVSAPDAEQGIREILRDDQAVVVPILRCNWLGTEREALFGG